MIRDQMTAAVSPELREGEKLVSVAMAQRGSSLWLALGALGMLLGRIRFYVIAYTDQRILICYTGKWSVKKLHEVAGELPLDTDISVTRGAWTNVTLPLAEGNASLRIASRFNSDINAGKASFEVAA